MVSGRGVSAMLCVAVGVGCSASVLGGHGGDSGAMVTIAAVRATPLPVAAEPPAQPVAVTTAEVDTSLSTGSIAPSSALHVPNKAAYADAAKAGSSLVLTGAEAINYLAGNTLRRETPGQGPQLTYFAWRGLMGEGDERGFTARRWDRDRSDLCETGPGGATHCRSITILLDGKYEFPGARLGTVTLGPDTASGADAAGTAQAGAVTAALMEGNALHFPDHIPLLDSSLNLTAPAPATPTASSDPIERLIDHPAVTDGDEAGAARLVVVYAKDNRRLELRQSEDRVGGGKAVQVTVGHWRNAKNALCQTRVLGEAGQTCFKAEALGDGGLRLIPTGKGGAPQTLLPLTEHSGHDLAQD